MEVLDINIFLSFKTNDSTQSLDTETINKLGLLFGSLDKIKKHKKYIKKSNVNILKSQKIQNKKDIISNKVNLILNKLSESNIDNLIIEFVENINQIDTEHFDEIQKAFYLKIISEINFIKIYLQFLKMISYLYNQVQKYNLSFFYSLVESKFKLDYTDYDISPESKYDFIKEIDGETKRINNLILIKNMVENNFINDTILTECDNIIINQKVFLPDIYHWFNSKNRELTSDEILKIKSLLKKDNINSRETILLETLINRKPVVEKANVIKTNITVAKPVEKAIKVDTLQLECENIIEEYVLIKSLDDVKYFIESRCLDAISKNRFCEFLIDKYFMSTHEATTDIIELIKQLTKSQTLFKSNLSRGLLLIYNNWKEKSIDYNKPTDKIKNLLNILKNIGITKGLEKLMEHYKI
jgi:hypothetical protein